MKDRFENVIPQAPTSFGYAVERALHETEAEEMNKRKFSISLVWVMIALLVFAGAAVAVGDHFGIVDFLSLNHRKDEDGAPTITTEYIGAKFTAGDYEFELTEYNYEGRRITLMFSTDTYTDITPTDLVEFSVDNGALTGINGSGHASGDENVSYFLEVLELLDGHDTETVRITDIETGEELFSFEAVRTAAASQPEGEVIILDDTMEGTGYTIVGYDVQRTTLTTELNLHIDVDPEKVELTQYEDYDEWYRECYMLTGDVWHFSGCEKCSDAVVSTAAEIMTGKYTPCSECVNDSWIVKMGNPELFDIKQLRIGWVTDESGERIDFGYGTNLRDLETMDPLKLVLCIEIDNTMLDKLPDVIYIRVKDFYRAWGFPDTAAVDVSALKVK